MRCVLLALLTLSATLAQEIRLTGVAQGIVSPTDIQSPRDGTGRLFLVQQRGLIRILHHGTVLSQPFLDLRTRVSPSGEERGLLGLAFPPAFAQSQRFYVNYTNLQGNTVIARYRATGDTSDPESETILLTINQPFANHNGGQLAFGPDGFLYVGMGDGGSANDPQNHGQNLGSLLGKMLRLDVEPEQHAARTQVANPFVNTPGARPEIWAYGLRNPWRFSFDRANGDLYIADVGQNIYEEIDYQPAASAGGENYGWRDMEGAHCVRAGCSQAGLTLPVAEYTHGTGDCSVTGGHVYRGPTWGGLRGVYLYADYCTGRIWGLERQDGNWRSRLLLDTDLRITTFGEDEAGELYVAGANSSIYRIDGVPTPRFSVSGVVNAASFRPGLSPGSLATIWASGLRETPGITAAERLPLPITLGDVSIRVGGTPAPILSVANVAGQEQVNFQVPYEATLPSADIVIQRGSIASEPVRVEISSDAPAIFTSDGTRPVLIRNATFALAPDVVPGEYVFLYATGLGAVSDPPPTGSAASSTDLSRLLGPLTLTLDGAPVEVQFAGLAPGFAGVYQVNFRVPVTAASGLRTLQLTTRTAAPAVRVAVR